MPWTSRPSSFDIKFGSAMRWFVKPSGGARHLLPGAIFETMEQRSAPSTMERRLSLTLRSLAPTTRRPQRSADFNEPLTSRPADFNDPLINEPPASTFRRP